MFDNLKELNQISMGRRIRVIRESRGITREAKNLVFIEASPRSDF